MLITTFKNSGCFSIISYIKIKYITFLHVFTNTENVMVAYFLLRLDINDVKLLVIGI